MGFFRSRSVARASLILGVALVARGALADVRVAPADDQMRTIFERPADMPLTVIDITGEITAADVEAVERTLVAMPDHLDDEVTTIVVARLDSPGGSFKAGVDIARLFNRHLVPTFVPAGAECRSACAVIFMAGILPGYEWPDVPSRQIQWPARLGFHRPFIGDFTSAITPGVIAETPPEELGAIFAEQFFQAFDTGNALIQEMLAVDTDAWSTELLVRMLTATGQREDEAFVYLETVDDALSWGIDVINAVRPPMSTRMQRFEVALAYCFNFGRRVESGHRRRWPPVADYDLQRRHNLEWEERWPGATFGEAGRIIGIAWDLWEGDDGCTVIFDGGEPDLAIEGVHYTNRPQNELLYWGPDVPLDRVVRQPANNVGMQDGDQGRCLVLNGDVIEDDLPCRLDMRRAADGSLIFDYWWPSGGKTVVEERREETLINGFAARRVPAISAEMDTCLYNTQTRKTFCYGGP